MKTEHHDYRNEKKKNILCKLRDSQYFFIVFCYVFLCHFFQKQIKKIIKSISSSQAFIILLFCHSFHLIFHIFFVWNHAVNNHLLDSWSDPVYRLV